MSLLAVNHHYVAETRPAEPRGIFPITTAEFEAELRELARVFEFVSRDDVLAAIAGGGALPDNACLVTFDDGLRCQLTLALPILERLGIPALFFVCGRPLVERRALHVHKIHALREQLPDAELLALVDAKLVTAGIDTTGLAEQAARTYRYDAPAAAELKYLLNAALPSGERERLVDELFARAFDETAFCAELYLSGSEVAELEHDHGAVGAHSYDHAPLALLDGPALASDLARNADALEQATGSRPGALSYPYGTPIAVSRAVADAARATGYQLAFTMERALNLTLDDPLLLARIDTNDAPTGSHPILGIGADGPVFSEEIALGRRLHMHEHQGAEA